MLQDTSTTTQTRIRLSVRNVAVALTVFAVAAGIVLGGFVFPPRRSQPQPSPSSAQVTTVVTGTLAVVQMDNVEQQFEKTMYTLTASDGTTLELVAPTDLPFQTYPANTTARVEGVRVGNQLQITGSEAITIESPQTPPERSAIGEERTVVVLANWLNYPDLRPWTRETVHAAMFDNPDSLNAYFREVSYDQMWLTGAVYGWYTLPVNATCDIVNASQYAIAAADPDVNFQDFDRLIIQYADWPNSNCTYITASSTPITTPDGGSVWVTFIIQSLDVTPNAHEIGHTLGLGEASGWDCGAVALGPNCAAYAYWHWYDVMGQGMPFSPHFSAVNKKKIGWLTDNQILDVTTSGTYAIEPLETATGGVKALRILVGDTRQEYLFLEYRQRIGFDDSYFLDANNIVNGVLVNYEPLPDPFGQAKLVDMTPNSIGVPPPYPANPRGDFADAVLEVGTIEQPIRYVTPIVTITPTERNASRILVNVTFTGATPCTTAIPTVTVNPPEIVLRRILGVTSPRTFTVSITNNDSPQCAPARFNLYLSFLNNQWVNNNTGSTFILAPGATGQSQVTISSPRTNMYIPAGTYDYDIRGYHNGLWDPAGFGHLRIILQDSGSGSPVFLKKDAPVAPGTTD